MAAACSEPLPAQRLDRAHSAVLDLVEDRVSTRFDDRDVYQDGETGLVCGGRVSVREDNGEYSEYRRYYFQDDRGAVIDDGSKSPLLAELTRRCDAFAYRQGMELFRGE